MDYMQLKDFPEFLFYTDTTDIMADRCPECGSVEFEETETRKFCIRCGLVVEDKRETNHT